MLIVENDELKSIPREEYLKMKNNLGKIYAMSDIHGCIEELKKQMFLERKFFLILLFH